MIFGACAVKHVLHLFTNLDYSYTYSNITKESAWGLKNILSSMFAQIYPQLLVSELLTYMSARVTLYSWFVSTSSTQIVPKVSNFSTLISSDQFSPQHMHYKYYNRRKIPSYNTHFRHMVLP